jgi:ribosomal protein L19
LVGKNDLVCLLSSVLFDEFNKIFQRGPGSLSNIEYFVLVLSINRTNDSIHDIINVRVITAGSTVPKLLDLNSAAVVVVEVVVPVL